MKKIAISFKITGAQFRHFEKHMELEGCESVTAMFRKAGFLRWPMPRSHEGIKRPLSDDSAITKQSLSNHLVQEEKKNLSIRAHMRVTGVSPGPQSRR